MKTGYKPKKYLIKTRKMPFVVMAGCMVGSVTGERQRYAFNELKKRTPWVNEYINPSQIMTIPETLLKNGLIGEWAVQKFDPSGVIAKQKETNHAFVNISFGCDNFCTFCVVPYARGKEVSRSKDDILKEITHLVGRGFSHVTLCGQNVNSWGLSTSKKFEFISSNPFDFTKDLIETLKLPKISNYLHIAVQSGNNDVLKNMNRRHTVEDFMDLINSLKLSKPSVEFGTDII